MIDGADLATLETKVRDQLGEETPKLWTSARIKREINNEVARLSRKIIDLDNGYFEKMLTFTPAATIAMPINMHILRAIEGKVGEVWCGLRWIEDHNRGQYQTLSNGTWPPMTVQWSGDDLLVPGYTQFSSIRVTYARAPADMITDTLASATSTSFTLSTASYYDDIYIGDRVLITSGTGVGQVRTITDYDAATFTATVATWTSTPDATSVVSWLLPNPLDKWSDLVVQGVAYRALSRRRDTESANQIMQTYASDLGDMMDALAQRQTDQPSRVNYIPDGLE